MEALSLEPRRLRDILAGQATVTLEMVDRALTNDPVTGLWELYPELYEEAA
jgi:hypothetical protein